MTLESIILKGPKYQTNTMKMKNIFILICVMYTLVLCAQTNDYTSYLSKARECLEAGNCEAAQRNYSVYKDLSESRDNSLEEAIAKCKDDNSSKSLSVGDELGNGWRIGYLDRSKEHGFIINDLGEYDAIVPNAFPEVSISELKLMYNDRYALKLRGEYWSTTKVEGKNNSYYTFDFSTGKVNERKNKFLGENRPKYKYLYIKRF